MAELLAFLFFVVLAGGIGVFGYRRLAKPSNIYDQMGGVAMVSNPVINKLTAEENPGLAVNVFELIGQQIPISPEDLSAGRMDLVAAGFRSAKAI